MKPRALSGWAALLALALVCGLQENLSAQVVEGREGEANPAATLFRAAAYGAGTGLLIGGAYAIIDEGDDPDVEESLRWGFAGGVVGGLALGLIYLATREEPEGETDEIGMLRLEEGALRLSAPEVTLSRRVDALGRSVPRLESSLFTVKF